MTKVRIEVFGGLRVFHSGSTVPVEGSVRRRLLAGLVARRGTTCRPDWLIELAWGDHPPGAPRQTLQSHIAHLRSRLEPQRRTGTPWDVIRSTDAGYRLAVEHVEVDADEVIAGVHWAHDAANPREALEVIERVLATATRPAYEEHRDLPAVEAEAGMLDLLVEGAAELQLELLSRLERYPEVIAYARHHVAEHPTRERAWLLLAAALGQSGRQAEGLRMLNLFRQLLADETGLDPSPDLADMEQQLLRGEGSTRQAPVRTPWIASPSEVRFASRGGVHIAYQAVGSGSIVVAVPPFAQNIEICWQDYHHRRLLERAANHVTFVHFDKRGTGMSDRAAELDLAERLDDFTAVLDDAEIDRAVLCGVSEAGPMAIAYAAQHPHRVAGLYLVNTFAKVLKAPDYPIGLSPDAFAAATSTWERAWGNDPRTIAKWFAPSLADDESYLAWLGHYLRQSCSPGTLAKINAATAQIDVRALLPSISTPTIVVHRQHDRVVPLAWGRYLAERIPGARFRISPGHDHLPWVGDDWHDIIDGCIELAQQS